MRFVGVPMRWLWLGIVAVALTGGPAEAEESPDVLTEPTTVRFAPFEAGEVVRLQEEAVAEATTDILLAGEVLATSETVNRSSCAVEMRVLKWKPNKKIADLVYGACADVTRTTVLGEESIDGGGLSIQKNTYRVTANARGIAHYKGPDRDEVGQERLAEDWSWFVAQPRGSTRKARTLDLAVGQPVADEPRIAELITLLFQDGMLTVQKAEAFYVGVAELNGRRAAMVTVDAVVAGTQETLDISLTQEGVLALDLETGTLVKAVLPEGQTTFEGTVTTDDGAVLQLSGTGTLTLDVATTLQR